jgi:hypothetical protein
VCVCVCVCVERERELISESVPYPSAHGAACVWDCVLKAPLTNIFILSSTIFLQTAVCSMGLKKQ